MIYGYERQTVNEYGLKEMREISVAASSGALRELASFILEKADEVENVTSIQWHRHIPELLAEQLGCDFIILGNVGTDSASTN